MGDETTRTAFDDPDTLRAWQRARRRSLWTFTLWGFSLPGFPLLTMVLWQSLADGSIPGYVVAPLVLLSTVGLVVSERRLSRVKQMKGILAVYPWKEHPPLKKVLAGDVAHFQLPDPDAPNKRVSVLALRNGLGKRWRATLTDARARGFAFAGDPRFGMVITPLGQHELIAVRPKHPPLTGGRSNGVDEAAWQLAQEAGTGN
ncbi:MAG: hypothetical protein JF597_39630 [Streptomyces sp.]|uniref:hypothetical protein n=1 Tax=Streptomyces sp. TaxID=1931 RepID=UPI0025E362D8|nr:hypothetical protein [Streptomyces sp.]MBW8799473.1 hypothetical protein [Streptomyces sp.]